MASGVKSHKILACLLLIGSQCSLTALLMPTQKNDQSFYLSHLHIPSTIISFFIGTLDMAHCQAVLSLSTLLFMEDVLSIHIFVGRTVFQEK